ncbi:MAG: hypothetical protein KME50_36410 [Nostoc desertorum CM1-VF14]|nr:hypothetical protein [Nostoc desertorum CM1-VF14]
MKDISCYDSIVPIVAIAPTKKRTYLLSRNDTNHNVSLFQSKYFKFLHSFAKIALLNTTDTAKGSRLTHFVTFSTYSHLPVIELRTKPL